MSDKRDRKQFKTWGDRKRQEKDPQLAKVNSKPTQVSPRRQARG